MLGLGAWYGGAAQVRLGCDIDDDAWTKSSRGQVKTPFPSGCSHWKKRRGTRGGGCGGGVHVGCGARVRFKRGGVKVKALASIASVISGSGSKLDLFIERG